MVGTAGPSRPPLSSGMPAFPPENRLRDNVVTFVGISFLDVLEGVVFISFHATERTNKCHARNDDDHET